VKKVVRLGLLLVVLLLYVLLSPFGYVGFALLHAFCPRGDAQRVRRAELLQRIMRWWFIRVHDLFHIARLIDFDARAPLGEPRTPIDGPVVLVANHPGLFDVTALMAAIPHTTTAVKPALFRRWWCRPLLSDAGFFEGAGESHDIGHVVEAGCARLRDGFNVLIFPEGTRSPSGGMHRFGRSAFEIACRAGVPVVPLCIAYAPVWLGKNQGFLALPAVTPRLRITALPAVRPADHDGSSRKLRDVIEAQLRARLGSAEASDLRVPRVQESGQVSRAGAAAR
jgi:1-acyl-sn-glycerol-3-phosphate acyltransferase